MSGIETLLRPRRARNADSGRRQVTLKQVAERAGVGQITASRVLREPDKVSPALRARVHAAMAELGYVANQVASGLASGTSRVVPVLIPTLAHAVYVPFLRGVHEVLERRGYEVLLGATEYHPETEARLVSTLLGWCPAGLLVAGVDHLPATRERLRQAVAAGLPVVEFMDLAEVPLDLNIGFSHRAVGAAVADWLADRGYRHIAYAGTLAGYDQRSTRRAEGFHAALAARGLQGVEVLSAAPFSIALGGQLLGELLQRHPHIEAVFFANDDLAAGALFEAQRRGIAVPRQLAVMGFNDLEIAAAMHPAITSVAVDQYGMGRRSGELLLQRLAGDAATPQRIDTGFRIVERDSTPFRAPEEPAR